MKKIIKKLFPRWKWDRKASAGILHLTDGEPSVQVEVQIPDSNTRKRFIADLDEQGEVLSIEVIDPVAPKE